MKKQPIIFKNVMFTFYDRYSITSEGFIEPDEGSRLPPVYILHSSNGYDYALLKSLDGNSYFHPIDEIVVSIFDKKSILVNSVYDENNKPHFRIIHLDGNLRNNNISNLKVEKDYEVWKPMVQPDDIVKNKYKVSSWGRVRNIETNTMLKPNIRNDGYPQVSLYCVNDNNEMCTRPKPVHRLVALHFVHNPDPESLNVIDHINTDKTDYSIKNLQWVTQQMNIDLGIKCGNGSISRITTTEIDMVIDLLILMKGSIKNVYNSIDHVIFPNITEAIINNIKHKDPAYIRHDGKYDLRNIQFEKRTRKQDLTDKEIETICQQLVECKFDLGLTLQKLHEMGLTHIERYDVRHIRDKSRRRDISDKYFQKTDYERPREPLSEQLVIEVCKALVECEGNIAKSLKLLHSKGFDIITKYDVQDTKYKKRSTEISDLFFTYENKEFKSL